MTLFDLDRERNRRRPWDAGRAAEFIDALREEVDAALAEGHDPNPTQAAIVMAVEKIAAGIPVFDLEESERDALAILVRAGRC